MTTTALRDTHLETLRRDAVAASEDARRLVAGLGEGELNWSPAPGAWSIAQCLDHLAITTQQYQHHFESAIGQGRKRGAPAADRPFRPGWFGRWFISAMGPDARKRFSVPKVLRPTERPPAGAAERFFREQHNFIALMESADGLDLNKWKLRSPVTPLMRFSIGEAFTALVAHTRRHLQQARRVREAPDFPRDPPVAGDVTQ